MIKTIRVFAKERKAVKEGATNKFLVFSYTKDGENFYEVKFTSDCDYRPTKKGYWLVDIDVDYCNIKKHKPDTQTGVVRNSTLWISKCTKAVYDVEYEEIIKEKKQQELESIF